MSCIVTLKVKHWYCRHIFYDVVDNVLFDKCWCSCVCWYWSQNWCWKLDEVRIEVNILYEASSKWTCFSLSPLLCPFHEHSLLLLSEVLPQGWRFKTIPVETFFSFPPIYLIKSTPNRIASDNLNIDDAGIQQGHVSSACKLQLSRWTHKSIIPIQYFNQM